MAKIVQQPAKIVVVVLITGALAFAAALALNDLVQSTIRQYLDVDPILAKLIYFGLLVLAIIVAGILIARYFPQAESLL